MSSLITIGFVLVGLLIVSIGSNLHELSKGKHKKKVNPVFVGVNIILEMVFAFYILIVMGML